MFSSPGPIALELGSVSLRWYGIIIGLGILAAYFWALKESRRRGVDEKIISDLVFWLVLCGVIGARLYFVLLNFEYFGANPVEALKIWRGGLAIHGALIGGGAAFFLYIWKHKIDWRILADILMPGVLLAQGIGRWGNFMNNEAFGGPTDLPWKLFIPFEFRPTGLEEFDFFHPTFLYESLWNFGGTALLIYLSLRLFPSKNYLKGTIFYSYMAWYGIGRFFTESLRLDSLYFGQLKQAQVMSVVLIIGGAIGLFLALKRNKIKYKQL